MPKTSTRLTRLTLRVRTLLKDVIETDYDSARMADAIDHLEQARRALEQAALVRKAQGD